MDRRRFLATTTGGVPFALLGCLGGDGGRRPAETGSGTRAPNETGYRGHEPHDPEPTDPPELPPGPEKPPDLPAKPTIDSVSQYVSAFEYAYVYNTLHCSDAQAIDVVSNSALERETDHGVYAFAAATGYSRCGSGEEPEHRDFGRDPYEWAVGDGYAVRIDDVDTTVTRDPDRAYGADGAETEASGLYLTNFDHHAHEIDVSVVHGGETAYEETVDIDPRSGLRVPNVSAVRADHALSVETDEGEVASGTWRVDPERSTDRMVRVLVTGEVVVERLDPYRELRRRRKKR